MTRGGGFRVAAVVVGLAGCEGAARSPGPTEYRWPEELAYRFEYLAEAVADTVVLSRFIESKTLRLVRRDREYLVWRDSLHKTFQRAGGPVEPAAYASEDTLHFLVVLGRHGELAGATVGCDPALPACAEARPSAIRQELRRIVPRLSLWPVPRGGTWVDTLSFDDAARAGGSRGNVVTTYTSSADTLMGARVYWQVSWHSLRTAFRRATAQRPIAPELPVEAMGITLVDKERMLPVYSEWVGAVGATPEMSGAGEAGTTFRGRAWLAGTPLDSVLSGGAPPP